MGSRKVTQVPAFIHAWLEAIRNVRVLVIGDLMLDCYIWGDASRISPEAPVPVVQVQRETSTAGGAANVAINIAAMGGKASLFGRIGKDEPGNELSAILQNAGISTIPGCVCSTTPTTVKTRVICRNQQLCRLDREPPPDACCLDAGLLKNLLTPFLSQIDAVLLSDYAKGVLTTEIIAGLQTWLPSSTMIAMDPKPRNSLQYRNLSLMTPNRAEALELAGIDDEDGQFPAEEVCTRIHEIYAPQKLVVTLGAEGMLLSEEGCVIDHIPTVAREVFDVSGAGDTVVAALTLALTAGLKFREAAALANLAAGVVVGKLGTATATPAEMLTHLESLT